MNMLVSKVSHKPELFSENIYKVQVLSCIFKELQAKAQIKF